MSLAKPLNLSTFTVYLRDASVSFSSVQGERRQMASFESGIQIYRNRTLALNLLSMFNWKRSFFNVIGKYMGKARFGSALQPSSPLSIIDHRLPEPSASYHP